MASSRNVLFRELAISRIEKQIEVLFLGFATPSLALPASLATQRPSESTSCGLLSAFLTISNILYKLMLMNSGLTLDATFSALSDPTRRAILAHLAKGEATVTELAKPFQMTQPAISQHLKVLEDAGLVVVRIDGTKRPRKLAKDGIEAMDRWLAMLRGALEQNYNRLDGVLAAMEHKQKGKPQ